MSKIILRHSIFFFLLILHVNCDQGPSRSEPKNTDIKIPMHIQEHIQKLSSANAKERVYAARSLLGTAVSLQDAIPFLIEMLNDNRNVELRILLTGTSGEMTEIKVPAKYVSETTTPAEEAAKVLVKIGEPGLQPLILSLKHEDSNVREKAACVLAAIADPSSAKALIKALSDEYAEVRVCAAIGLGKLRESRAVSKLLAATQDEQAKVRERAIWALGEIRDLKTIENITASLTDENQEVRATAARSLGRMKDSQSVKPLITAMKNENIAAKEALVMMGDAAVNQLLQSVDDSDPEVRADAIWVIGEIGSNRATDILILALKDKKAAVRSSAAEALGKIRDPKAVPNLIEALRDENSNVRVWTAEALGEIMDPRATKPLLVSRHDRDLDVREAAFDSLIKISKVALEDLISELNDKDSRVRSDLIDILGDSADPRVVKFIIAALQDKDKDVRWSAVEALGKINDPQTVPPLVELLKSGNVHERIIAAESLSGKKYYEAIDYLVVALRDEEMEVRLAAGRSLEAITGKHFGKIEQDPAKWEIWWKKNQKRYIKAVF